MVATLTPETAPAFNPWISSFELVEALDQLGRESRRTLNVLQAQELLAEIALVRQLLGGRRNADHRESLSLLQDRVADHLRTLIPASAQAMAQGILAGAQASARGARDPSLIYQTIIRRIVGRASAEYSAAQTEALARQAESAPTYRSPRRNLNVRADSETGVRGVSRRVLQGGKVRYRARAIVQGRRVPAGTWRTLKEAQAAVRQLENLND